MLDVRPFLVSMAMRVNLMHDLIGAVAANELAEFLASIGADVVPSAYSVYPIGDSLSAALFGRSDRFEATFVLLGCDSRHRSWVLSELRVARSLRDTTRPGPGLIPVFYESDPDRREAGEPFIKLFDGSDWKLAVLKLLRPPQGHHAAPT